MESQYCLEILAAHISVVIVSGGEGGKDSVELLNTDGTWNCPLPPMPSKRKDHSQSGLVACGGVSQFHAEDSVKISNSTTTSCVTLSSDWKDSHNLTEERIFHSSWASPRGVILLGGEGWKDHGPMKTSEILTEDGDTTPGFNLGYNSK